jgi:hypothetical protein
MSDRSSLKYYLKVVSPYRKENKRDYITESVTNGDVWNDPCLH